MFLAFASERFRGSRQFHSNSLKLGLSFCCLLPFFFPLRLAQGQFPIRDLELRRKLPGTVIIYADSLAALLCGLLGGGFELRGFLLEFLRPCLEFVALLLRIRELLLVTLLRRGKFRLCLRQSFLARLPATGQRGDLPGRSLRVCFALCEIFFELPACSRAVLPFALQRFRGLGELAARVFQLAFKNAGTLRGLVVLLRGFRWMFRLRRSMLADPEQSANGAGGAGLLVLRDRLR